MPGQNPAYGRPVCLAPHGQASGEVWRRYSQQDCESTDWEHVSGVARPEKAQPVTKATSRRRTAKAEKWLPSIFVAIPVLNEVGAIKGVLIELVGILAPISARLRILVVDDGSSDGTPDLLRGLKKELPVLETLELVRRTGQSIATQAALDRIPDWADVVVQMDGDGQDDPNDIPAMLRPILEGTADMVTGWRQKRAESFLRTLASRTANKIIASATRVHIHDFGSPLKVMRADLARTLSLRGDMHRFVPALGSLAGARLQEYPVVQRKRESGRSKYGLGRTGKVILDIIGLYFILNFAERPIRLFGTVGIWFLIIGLGILAYLGIDRIFFNVSVTTRPIFLISVFFLLTAVIVIMNGLVAELLSQSIFRRGVTARSYIAKGEWGTPLSSDRDED